MLFINQYYQNSPQFVPNATTRKTPRSTTSAHKATSSTPWLLPWVVSDKSLSPFPKSAPKALQRSSKSLRDFTQFLSPSTSSKHITRAWGQQTLVRKRAGDEQGTAVCAVASGLLLPLKSLQGLLLPSLFSSLLFVVQERVSTPTCPD